MHNPTGIPDYRAPWPDRQPAPAASWYWHFSDGITARARTLTSHDWSPQVADKDSPNASKEDASKSDSCGAGTWLGDLEDEYADAHIDQHAQLGDREADAGPHPCDQPQQGNIADAEEETGRQLHGGTPWAQPCGSARRHDQHRPGGQDPQCQREVGHLCGHLRPLRGYEIAAPEHSGRACEEKPAAVAVGRSSDADLGWGQ